MTVYYTYQFIAVNADGDPDPTAAGSLYDPDDTAFASPLTVTDRDGTVGTTVKADRRGLVVFTVPDVVRGRWKSGVMPSQPVTAWEAADTAAAAAEAAQAAAEAAAAQAEAPTTAVVQQVVNTENLAPTGAWDFTAATVTGLAPPGPDMTITDQGTYYDFDVVDGGNVAVTDNTTYWTFTI